MQRSVRCAFLVCYGLQTPLGRDVQKLERTAITRRVIRAEVAGSEGLRRLSVSKRRIATRGHEASPVPRAFGAFTSRRVDGSNGNSLVVERFQRSEDVAELARSRVVSKHLGDADKSLRQPVPSKSVRKDGFLSQTPKSVIDFLIGVLLIGVLLIIFSIPVLWQNERRSAEMESLIHCGVERCQTVSSKSPSGDHHAHLVHVCDGKAVAAATVTDARFKEVTLDAGCLRLRSTVEVYQWIENKSTESEDQLGGGRVTTTTYTYTQGWSKIKHDSSSFNDPSKQNSFPPSISLGTETVSCSCVHYGTVYVLPEGLVSQLDNFQEAKEILPREVTAGNTRFTLGPDNSFYSRSSEGSPLIGDARVQFKYVPEGDATVVALEAEAVEVGVPTEDGRVSFLPYRTISRGICGLAVEEEQRRLVREGQKSEQELMQDAVCDVGPFACLCCACNIVSKLMLGHFKPEIFYLFEGSKTVTDCFAQIQSRQDTATLLIRLTGWLMMFVGFCLLFSPLLAVLAVIPFLSKIGGFAVVVMGFLVTLPIAALISGLAYLTYRPLKAIIWLGIAAILLSLVITLTAPRAASA